MLYTYHIHVKGLVQGVGFRPFVYRLAKSFDLSGWVSNTNDGVHIEFSAPEDSARDFYCRVIDSAPSNAVITAHSIAQVDQQSFVGFEIADSSSQKEPDLLLTPDIAICPNCKEEINNSDNNRFGYAFTTCLNCGPRYSIVQALPYDREGTTMSELIMCPSCESEYNNVENRRHYSQTNSCPECSIKMHLYQSGISMLDCSQDKILGIVASEIRAGRIIAVKGMGGYLLLCDASNEKVVSLLRERKQRPAKPFAVLYGDANFANADVILTQQEIDALNSKAAPIVLCQRRASSGNLICADIIAPGLDKIGVMLPSTPLLSLLSNSVGGPMICTSANISGSPIIYKDEDALENLFDVADLVLTYDREIVTPQDDSVIQFSKNGRKIILRRSRGLAPNYFPVPFKSEFFEKTVLATGGELKGSFAILNKENLYISQYLGDQGTLESQQSYAHTLDHMYQLVKCRPEKVLIDMHPNYSVSQYGKKVALFAGIGEPTEVQHHMAHFGAVLAENNLLKSSAPILGFIWDGTGYGTDKQIWGGEIFRFSQNQINRVGHLKYFPQLMGDKMSKEPRLSALSLLKDFPSHQEIIRNAFSEKEWSFYQKAIQQEQKLFTSSMGRFLDGLACILGIQAFNTYEGEAAMQMEALARSSDKVAEYYTLPFEGQEWNWYSFVQSFVKDIEQGKEQARIARKVFQSLAKAIFEVSRQLGIEQMAFSGGVFQNALLCDLLLDHATDNEQLYFHQQLSPNDENIGFGQMACYQISQQAQLSSVEIKEESVLSILNQNVCA